jgi:hypothetical protein
VDALLGDDAQAGGLDLGVDGAGQIAAGGVGLDDGKGAFESPCFLPSFDAGGNSPRL